MDLHTILTVKPDTPYFRPPPIKLYVVAAMDMPKVVSWEFSGNSAKPLIKKKNKIAAITDGKTVAKITVFEEFVDKITGGNHYVVRGYALRGQSPPYLFTFTKETQVFRSPPVTVSEDLIQEGKALLEPPSPLTTLDKCGDARGFMSVEGEVVEVSSVKRVKLGREEIPLKNITIQKDSTRVALSLWREAAVEDLQLGSHVRVCHLKAHLSGYGLQLQSTIFTKFETMNKETHSMSQVVGVMESETPGMVELLLATNEVYKVEAKKWHPFEADLNKGPIEIKFKACGDIIGDFECVTA